jgi:para-nitrobenzyl esterase
MAWRRVVLVAMALCLAASAAGGASQPSKVSELADTSWRLVRIEVRDGAAVAPDDRTKYTIAFGRDGQVSARIDCNRGRATWTSSAPGQIQLGPLAMTRAKCPPGSLHDRIVKDWELFRGYALKGGRLLLTVGGDQTVYEFEPTAARRTDSSVHGRTKNPASGQH